MFFAEMPRLVPPAHDVGTRRRVRRGLYEQCICRFPFAGRSSRHTISVPLGCSYLGLVLACLPDTRCAIARTSVQSSTPAARAVEIQMVALSQRLLGPCRCAVV